MIEREEITATIVNLATLVNVMEAILQVHPDASRMWQAFHTYEEMAHLTEEYNATFSAHMRAGLEALDALRSAHGDLLGEVVTAAENILKEES